ncbi:NAD-dependent epimerase/dehydratase family protein [candidate division KSB1 bacterium]|nr:NAD-dependent epimerase/dehydratase family protein [candidate division KSB1 bacterium]
MRALVTGSNGFIGSALVEYLLEQSFEVTSLVRRTSDLRWIENLPIRLVYADLGNPSSLAKTIAASDRVFHLAGVTKAKNTRGYHSGNVEATKNLLSVCKQHGPEHQKFVFVSSQAAGGPSPDGRPITEADPSRPISEYGRSKLEAERYVLEYSCHRPACVVRPSSVYGPRDRDILQYFINVNRGLLPFLGDGRQKISMIHVQDLVRGIFLASHSRVSDGRVYYMTGDGEWDWRRIGDLVAEILKKKPIKVSVPFWLLDMISFINLLYSRAKNRPALLNRDKVREMKQPNWLCSYERAQAELQFKPLTSLLDGFRTTLEWYRSQGWLNS